MIDTKLEMDLIRQRIMTGLGVSEAMMNSPTTYATAGIGYDPAIQELVRKMADPFFTFQDPDDPTRVIWKAMTRDEYVKENLDWEMRRCRGRKRLRKKKAKRALRQRWGFLQMVRMISRRINYAAIARKLVTVEFMDYPVKPIYMRDIDIADVPTGGN